MMEKHEWNYVPYRRQRKIQFHRADAKVRAIGHYWNGFDKNGREKWYVELSDGRLLTDKDENYMLWVRRYYPNQS